MFDASAIINVLGNAVGTLEGVVTQAVAAAGAKADVVTKVQEGMDAFKTAAASLAATMTPGEAKPILQEISDAFVAVDNALTQLPLGGREATIAQIAGFAVPMLLNAARVIWH